MDKIRKESYAVPIMQGCLKWSSLMEEWLRDEERRNLNAGLIELIPLFKTWFF